MRDAHGVRDDSGDVMPSKPPRTCSTPGCPGLTTRGKCEVCRENSGQNRGHNWQDDRVRGSRIARGYDKDWLTLRKRKAIANPLCEACERQGRVTVMQEVHHKIPFRGLNDPLRLDWNNLESLCRACHAGNAGA